MTGGPWFIADQNSWHGETVRLPKEESRHAISVLRLAPPDIITVTDGDGNVAHCAVERIEDGEIVAEVLDRVEHRRPRPSLAIYQGAPKGHKADDVIERLG